jgi:hypothetical protein
MGLKHGLRRLAFTVVGLLVISGCDEAREPSAPPADFSGVWTSPGAEYVRLPEQNSPKFTAEAARNLAHYERHYDPGSEDPAMVCLLKGMPWTILLRPRDYPVEIYQTSDRIVMFFELYDTSRNIRLDEQSFPENLPPAPNGYSVAHWEGKALVIETRNMPAINPISPYPRSDQAHIIERWTLQQHPQLGETLHVEVTMHDPEIYAEPGRGEMIFKRAPAGTKVGGYNCSSQLWDDYVARREQELALATAKPNNTATGDQP